MAIDPIKHAMMFAASMLCGLILVVFYEFMEVFPTFFSLVSLHYKKKINNSIKNIFFFFKDLFLCFLIGCTLILVMYINNDGEFRIMAPLGMFLGAFVGQKTLGRIVRYAMKLLAQILFKILALILHPAVFLGCKIKKMLIDCVGRRIKCYLNARTATKQLTYNDGIQSNNEKTKRQEACKPQEPVDGIGIGVCSGNFNWNVHG